MTFSLDTKWLKQTLKTRQGWAGALTAFVPVALVLGRAPADVVCSLAAVLFLVDCVLRRNWSWAKTPWIATVLALWAYCIARAAFIPDHGKSIFAAFTWLRYIFFAVGAGTWALQDAKWREILLRSTIVVTVFLSLDAILQYIVGVDILGHERIDHGERLTASFTRPIVGMSIANLMAPGVFWLLDRKRMAWSGVLGLIAFLAILFSGERMALLFTLCIVLVWFFVVLRTQRKSWPVLIAALCIVVIVVGSRPDLFHRQVQMTSKVISHVGASPYGLAWHSGLQVGKANPVFGVGIHQFRFACTDESFGPLTDEATGFPRCYVHPHNSYLEWFAEGGAIGLGLFVLFVVLLLNDARRYLIKNPGNMLLWGLGITIAVRLMPFFTSTSFFNNWSAIPLWLCIGLMLYEGTASARRKGA